MNTDVAVVICTYRRNGPLRQLLERLVDEAATSTEPVRLGVAVIDDSPDGEAKDVASAFAERFPHGVAYRNTASASMSSGCASSTTTACRRRVGSNTSSTCSGAPVPTW